MKRIIFGYKDFHDIFTTVFSKTVWVHAFSVVWVVLISLAGLIYNSKELVLILFLLMMADWGTGVWKSVRAGTFNSYTFQRMWFNLVLKFGLIAASYQISLHSWIFDFLRLPEVIMTGFLLTEFISLVENVHAIDSRIIPEKMYRHLKTLMDLDTVIAQYFKPKEAPGVALVAAVVESPAIVLEGAPGAAGDVVGVADAPVAEVIKQNERQD